MHDNEGIKDKLSAKIFDISTSGAAILVDKEQMQDKVFKGDIVLLSQTIDFANNLSCEVVNTHDALIQSQAL